MAYIMENLTQYDLTEQQAERLSSAGLIVKNEEYPELYDLTAYVWDDLGLTGERAYKLLDLVLEED